MRTQYTLHAQVLELRALAVDGREVHVPVAINTTELPEGPMRGAVESATLLLEGRIRRAKAMADAMLAARPTEDVAAETEASRLRADVIAAALEANPKPAEAPKPGGAP